MQKRFFRSVNDEYQIQFKAHKAHLFHHILVLNWDLRHLFKLLQGLSKSCDIENLETVNIGFETWHQPDTHSIVMQQLETSVVFNGGLLELALGVKISVRVCRKRWR